MSSLGGLLTGRTPSGVYLWDGDLTPAALARTAEVADWNAARVDGALLLTKEETLVALGEALGFPESYEADLGTLWECLREVRTPLVILWDQWDVLAERDAEAFMRILGVLGHRATDGGVSLLLRGGGPDLGIPTLPA